MPGPLCLINLLQQRTTYTPVAMLHLQLGLAFFSSQYTAAFPKLSQWDCHAVLCTLDSFQELSCGPAMHCQALVIQNPWSFDWHHQCALPLIWLIEQHFWCALSCIKHANGLELLYKYMGWSLGSPG